MLLDGRGSGRGRGGGERRGGGGRGGMDPRTEYHLPLVGTLEVVPWPREGAGGHQEPIQVDLRLVAPAHLQL